MLAKRRASILLALGVVMVAAPLAAADDGSRWDRQETQGGVDGQTVYTGASFKGVVFDPPPSGQGKRLSPSSDSAWVPPPCYYAPRWKASEFKAFWDDHARPLAWKTEGHYAESIVRTHDEKYGPDSEYKDHNIDKEDEGSWWTLHYNPDSPRSGERASCESRTFWVDYTDPPPALPGVPDAETLAELAYGQVEIPDIAVDINPGAQAQKVNLDTWVWLGAGELSPVSVTASLDGYSALSSTVTATPKRLVLDPGTDEAVVHAGGSGCEIGADGSIGEAWASGKSDRTPPCGVTYHRATNGGSYTLSATLVWEISWEGSDGSGAQLPDGEFTTTQQLTVEEIQAVVR